MPLFFKESHALFVATINPSSSSIKLGMGSPSIKKERSSEINSAQLLFIIL
jgi:hypothetical protein